MTTKTRFSKATVTDYCNTRIDALVKEFRIDRNNGTAQCRGKSEEFCRAFGEYAALRDVLYLTK